MFKFPRAYQQTAEFIARQGELLITITQKATSATRAELRANLERIKKQWRNWFPRAAIHIHQLVLELDAIAQLPLFNYTGPAT